VRKARLTTQQVGQAGEHLVAAEIHLRGGYAATFTGNMPGIDVLATDAARTRTVQLQVKTRSSGSWHSNTSHAVAHEPVENETSFWVFVDLTPEYPEFYVVPNWWIENEISGNHRAYLARHGGVRPVNPDSTHTAVREAQIAQWKDRWDQLGILPPLAVGDTRVPDEGLTPLLAQTR
jgi:hypothetical protein